MPALQVKDFPEDLYEDLKKYAAEDCRSVSQQVVYVLREYLKLRKKHGYRSDPWWEEWLANKYFGLDKRVEELSGESEDNIECV